jgi:nicotinamide-nucleotide amidase
MRAEIFSIGTELLMGELTDTNTSWIAARLAPLGVRLHWASILGDDLDRLSEAFSRGLQRSDIIFTTGGLGPTQDDLTREAVAKALGETPVVQQEVVEALERYFQARGTPMPPHNVKQAHLIPSARFIPNRNGTAPGWWVERNGKIVVCMPGPPREMQAIWEEEVAPQLRKIAGDEVTLTRNVKTMGMSEGAVDEVVSEFFGQENPYLGIYSKADGIHLRIIARARNTAAAQELIQPVEEAIVARLAPYIWGYDDDTPEQSTGRVLKERGLTLATMESCTGGFLANSITEVPDSDAYFKGGVVAYTNPVKIANGVPEATIENHGAVSQQTATAMARAIREKLGADFGIGITGVAGPSEQEGKPAGLGYLSVAGPVEVREMELRLPPRRLVIKRRLSNQALIELGKLLAQG